MKVKKPEQICDICKTNCNGLIGIEINLTDIFDSHPEIKRVKKMFGKTNFKICFVCWLKSLGIRPL